MMQHLFAPTRLYFSNNRATAILIFPFSRKHSVAGTIVHYTNLLTLTHSLTHTYPTTQTTKLTHKPARTHIQADLLCHFILDHSSFQSYLISTCYSFTQIIYY